MAHFAEMSGSVCSGINGSVCTEIFSQILKEIFTTDADLIPDYKNGELIVRLHSLSTPRANEAVKKLCVFLNDTKTIFPYTNLNLIYETVGG